MTESLVFTIKVTATGAPGHKPMYIAKLYNQGEGPTPILQSVPPEYSVAAALRRMTDQVAEIEKEGGI